MYAHRVLRGLRIGEVQDGIRERDPVVGLREAGPIPERRAGLDLGRVELPGSLGIGTPVGEARGRREGVGARLRMRRRIGQRQGRLGPLETLGEVAAPLPEAPQVVAAGAGPTSVSCSMDQASAARRLSCSSSSRSSDEREPFPMTWPDGLVRELARRRARGALAGRPTAPRSFACSMANSRIVSSIVNRGSPSTPSAWRTRLFSVSDVSPSRVSPPSPLHTLSISSSPAPPTNTERRAKSSRSSSSSMSWLHAIAPRSVCCRAGRSRAPADSSPSRSPSRPSIAWGVRTRIRAAASSIASGRPSRRTQISATAGAFSFVTSKPGRTARARSMNSATASYCESCDSDGRLAGSGRPSGGTGYSCSPDTWQRASAAGQDRRGSGRRRGARSPLPRPRAPARSCRGRAALVSPRGGR